MKDNIEKFAELILKSRNIVALTGAGMSTESGIADFRSPKSGLWTKVDPYEFASISSYIANTSKNLSFMLEVGASIFRAKPNKGHKALTKLQRLGKLKGVLTQNIDGLHKRAKTKNVIELHGTANESKCLRCGRIYPITTMINQVLKEGVSPSCEKCDGILKPNAIFFGEPLETTTLIEADRMIANCDFLMVLGSSLVVYPVAFYPQKLVASGAKLAIINIQETDMDSQAEVVIHDKIGETLPEIVSIVEQNLKS